jgi:hypothetical protein
VDEEPPLDTDEGLLLGELHDEGLDDGFPDELGCAGGAPPWHDWTGSPTFPDPALASASLAAASKACDWEGGAEVGSGDIKGKLPLLQTNLRGLQ